MALRPPSRKKKPRPTPKPRGLRSAIGKALGKAPNQKINPHKDSGDKKPSLKTKASIIKDKAKKGQGLKRGGKVKK